MESRPRCLVNRLGGFLDLRMDSFNETDFSALGWYGACL